jgi:hypothetical protein
VEKLNSRLSSSQCKRNESKRSQNDESSHIRKGKEEEREEQKYISQKTTHKSNPRGHEEVRASIPIAIFGSYTNLSSCGPLS